MKAYLYLDLKIYNRTNNKYITKQLQILLRDNPSLPYGRMYKMTKVSGNVA